jgi:hypothetical protein
MRHDDLLSQHKMTQEICTVRVIKADGALVTIIELALDPLPNVQDWQYEEDADVLYDVLKASLPIATWAALAGRFNA